jgi:hypothetical protein
VTNLNKNGLILIPDDLQKVTSQEAEFKAVINLDAKKLILERENDLIGDKIMIHVFNNADHNKEKSRTVSINFFKNSLGFTEDEIILVDISEF